MARARAVRSSAAAVLTFPFSQELVDAIKATIPARARSYDPTTKAWSVSAPYTDLAVLLLRRIYPDAEVYHADQAHRQEVPPPAARPAADPYAVLHLLPSAPPELVDAAQRCLARLHHPDRQPEALRPLANRQMAAINGAADTLRARRGAA